jgi:Tfp pilus assembly pilus retraction ATPase PilT
MTAQISPTTWASTGRFRVNVMRQLNGLGAVMRAIPSKALSMAQLKLPPAIHTLCRANNGLILVTGKTGSGKSTTLAAMIDDINSRIKGHILTIEDPIEFVHLRKAMPHQPREGRRAHQRDSPPRCSRACAKILTWCWSASCVTTKPSALRSPLPRWASS